MTRVEFTPTVSRSPLSVRAFDRWKHEELTREPVLGFSETRAEVPARGRGGGRPGIRGVGIPTEPGRPLLVSERNRESET